MRTILPGAGDFSIKAILHGVIGAVALPLIAVSVWSLWTGWNGYQRASHVELVSGVDKLIFQTMQALRNERSGLNRARSQVDQFLDAVKAA